MIKNIKWLLLASITFVACSKDVEETIAPIPEVPLTKGSADFTKYVALGNSLTAGFSDGALFKAGQDGSYTNLMAKQFATVGGGAFKIPYMNDNIGGLLFGGVAFPDPTQFGPRLTINGVDNKNNPNIISLAELGKKQTTEATSNIFAQGPYNNMGVPGAKSFHLLAPGYGQANPYFGRFASSPTTTVVDDAVAQKPTFFSLWIGNNDVLAYALSGGTGVNQSGNLNPATYGINDITDSNVFANVYNGLITKLTSTGAKGVVANIPYITTIPQFTTVPYNPLTARSIGSGDEAVGIVTIRTLNTNLYGPLKAALTAIGAADRIKLLTETGNNPLLIKDESLPNLSAQLTTALAALGPATAGTFGAIYGQARQATQKDLFLLATQRVIGSAPTAATSGIGIAPPAPLDKFGITFPLQDKDVLIPTEIAELKIATDAYNATIKSLADSKGLAFVDANALLTKVATGGVRYGQYQLSSSYVVGGAFSLDGVHPAPQGYALIANEFMKAINAKYGSTLRMYDLSNFISQYPKDLPN